MNHLPARPSNRLQTLLALAAAILFLPSTAGASSFSIDVTGTLTLTLSHQAYTVTDPLTFADTLANAVPPATASASAWAIASVPPDPVELTVGGAIEGATAGPGTSAAASSQSLASFLVSNVSTSETLEVTLSTVFDLVSLALSGQASVVLTLSCTADGNECPLSVSVQPGEATAIALGVKMQGEAYEGEPVPEPTSMLLLGTGLVGLVARCRRRQQP